MHVGQKTAAELTADEKENHTCTGRVVYIHPERRFYMVEFDFSIPGTMPGEVYRRTIRQCYPIPPARERMCSSMERETAKWVDWKIRD